MEPSGVFKPSEGRPGHTAGQHLPIALLLAGRWVTYATAVDVEPPWLEEDRISQRMSPMERMALNLHRMKKFQRGADLLGRWRCGPVCARRPDRPAARLPAADSAWAQEANRSRNGSKPETRANWAFHRIPAQSHLMRPTLPRLSQVSVQKPAPLPQAARFESESFTAVVHGLDLRGGEGAVVDADIVDEAGEITVRDCVCIRPYSPVSLRYYSKWRPIISFRLCGN